MRQHDAQSLDLVAANKLKYKICNEGLYGIKDIKILGLESVYEGRFKEQSLLVAESQVAVGLTSQLPQYVMQTIVFGGMIILCLVLMDGNNLNGSSDVAKILPTLGVFAFAGQRMMPEVFKLYRGLTQLNYGSAAVNAVHSELMEATGTELFPCKFPKPMGLAMTLTLDQVSYRYPNADTAGLSKVSVTLGSNNLTKPPNHAVTNFRA